MFSAIGEILLIIAAFIYVWGVPGWLIWRNSLEEDPRVCRNLFWGMLAWSAIYLIGAFIAQDAKSLLLATAIWVLWCWTSTVKRVA